MKIIIKILLILSFSFQLHAESIYTFNMDDFFPKNIKIDELYPPSIDRQLNGKSFILSYWKKLEFNNENIKMRIVQKFSTDIFPYEESSLDLLKSIYSNYDCYSQLFPKDKRYFDDRNVDRSFIFDYVAKGPRYISEYKPDVIISYDGTQLERDYSYGVWRYSSIMDTLSYYFIVDRGFFSEYVIEFYDLWYKFNIVHDESHLYMKLQNYQPPDGGEYIRNLYTLTNEELDAYPDQSDPSIRLMHLLNEAMENFRFKDRPNAPPANLGTVNDNLVRLRSEPTLSGEVLGHVNTDEEVIVMEQSPEEQIIGGQKSRWYKVVSKTSCLKGWMFGSFLDFKTTP